MKKTIIQCVTAFVCVLAISITSVICADKISKVPATQTAAGTGQSDAASGTDTATADTAAADNTAVDANAPADATATDATAADNGTNTAGGNTAGGNTSGGSSSGTTAKAPSTPAEIATYYNNAINKVISSKAGYSKTRISTLGTLKGAEAIMKISIARDAVYNFLGIKTLDYTNKKGEAKYLSTASLKAADVKSATCTTSGSTYVLTLNLVNGKSTASESGFSDTSPLQRSGLFVGHTDNADFDYKSAENLYKGLNGDADTSVKAIEETTLNAKIVAKVDSASGKLTALDVTFDWNADLTDVKYTIIKVSGTGDAKTSVSVKNFAW